MRLRFGVLCLLLVGCDGATVSDDAGADASDEPADAGSDAGPAAADPCEVLGLPSRPFDATATGAAFEAVAGDFTVQTLDGPWTLSEEWSGCESYVFVNHSSSAYGDGLWASPPDALFTDGPRNVHYFFGSYDPTASVARAKVEEMRDAVESGFDFHGLSEDDRAWWRARIHYVTEPIRVAEGSVGALTDTSPIVLNAFAITREQRFDPVGSLMAVGRAGFEPRLEMARFAAPYFDYIHDLDAAIDADGAATVVPLLEDETTTARTLDRTVTLPDAATMAGFDTLEVDVELTCHLTPDGCSEWDRIAYVTLCDDATCASTQELVRWITPYSRPGRRRWLMDATPLLGLLADGGERTFRVIFGPDWEEPTEREVSVDLRLSDRSTPDAPIGAELAFRGGPFGADYNTGRAPFAFTPPAGTTRVELAVIVSGHGMEADNCAEWCNHVHTFDVNGAATHEIAFGDELGEPLGCAELASEGVPPGQWGNWAPRRAGWCPGLPVPTRRFDVTADVDLAGLNELAYRGSYMGGEPRGGTIDLSAYLVYYR